MTTLKIVPNDAKVEEGSEILGLVVRAPDGSIRMGERTWNAVANSGELYFDFDGHFPSPRRIGPESDSGVLLLFNSDQERTAFLAKLTAESKR